MKKRDLILIISILVVAVVSIVVFNIFSVGGKNVVISQNNQIIKELPLSENTMVELGTNIVEIKDGSVKVIYANCENQICVNHKAVSKKGESIVCLPNKVIVKVK